MKKSLQIIEIVIGPPGCGKTTYCKSRCREDSTLVLYDDFLTHSINGRIWKDMKDGKNIIANDPRLCFPGSLKVLIKKLKKLVKKEDVILTLFDTTLEQCTANIKKRMKNGDARDTLSNLKRFFDSYRPNIYHQMGYQVRTLKLQTSNLMKN